MNPAALQGAQVAFDEYGQPFIILREQDKQKRLTGLAAPATKVDNTRATIRIMNELPVSG